MPRRPDGGPGLPGGAPGKRTQLNRALSKLGLCSRGEAARLVAAGRVRVNGAPARDPEAWVELGSDRIEVEGMGPAAEAPRPGGEAPSGETGALPSPRRYLVLHKPPGYVTTRSDELGRPTVYDLLPPGLAGGWVFPVGRLDRDSEGLLLLTDDGEWADALTDPARHVDKTYRVKLDARPLPADLAAFRAGVEIEGRRTLPAGAEPDGGTWVRVTLREGRNRQIRRMFHALGYKVKRLVRLSIGPLELGGLEPGQARPLAPAEVEALRRAAAG